MARRKKKKSRRFSGSEARATAKFSGPSPRNACIDTLRGLAIVLMIVDHVAWLYWNTSIEPTTIRFLTRLSMPLFCVLTGYLVITRREIAWERLSQVAAAAAVVNVAYFSLVGKLEILASLLVCYVLIAVIGRSFAVGFIAFAAYPVDFSDALFDYPLSAVITCVAVGAGQRLFGSRVAVCIAILIAATLLVARGITGSFGLVPPPTVYVLLFLPLASLLLAMAIAKPEWRISGLEWVGRYPLSIYVSHYLILLLFNR